MNTTQGFQFFLPKYPWIPLKSSKNQWNPGHKIKKICVVFIEIPLWWYLGQEYSCALCVLILFLQTYCIYESRQEFGTWFGGSNATFLRRSKWSLKSHTCSIGEFNRTIFFFNIAYFTCFFFNKKSTCFSCFFPVFAKKVLFLILKDHFFWFCDCFLKVFKTIFFWSL